jgi:hypothetical protein
MNINHATAHDMVRGLSMPHGSTVTRATLFLNGKARAVEPDSVKLACDALADEIAAAWPKFVALKYPHMPPEISVTFHIDPTDLP